MASRTTISQVTFLAATMAITVPLVPVQAASVPSSSQVVSLADYRSLRQASVWATLNAKLDKWGDLSDDWNGEGAIAPLDKVIGAAEAFLLQLQEICAPVPQATIATDGEISFEWVNADGFASASFTDDGHLIAFLRESGVIDPLRIDVPYSEEAGRSFLERIGAFA